MAIRSRNHLIPAKRNFNLISSLSEELIKTDFPNHNFRTIIKCPRSRTPQPNPSHQHLPHRPSCHHHHRDYPEKRMIRHAALCARKGLVSWALNVGVIMSIVAGIDMRRNISAQLIINKWNKKNYVKRIRSFQTQRFHPSNLMLSEVLWTYITEDTPISRVVIVSIGAIAVTYVLVHWLAPDFDLKSVDASDKSVNWTMALP
jgi:hypothetical protein